MYPGSTPYAQTGQGSLAVNGAITTFDMRLLAASATVKIEGGKIFSPANVTPIRLLPGAHSFVSSALIFDFTTVATGNAVFDTSLENILTGNGTSLITYRGLVNYEPTANAGGPYSGAINTAIQFNGSLSFDPRGGVLTYAWDFGDGTTG